MQKKNITLFILFMYLFSPKSYACHGTTVGTPTITPGAVPGTYEVTLDICIALNSWFNPTSSFSIGFAGANITAVTCGGFPNYTLSYDNAGSPACDGSETFSASNNLSGGILTFTGTTPDQILTNTPGLMTPYYGGDICTSGNPPTLSGASIGTQPYGNCTTPPSFNFIPGSGPDPDVYAICFTTTVIIDAYPSSVSISGLEVGSLSTSNCNETIPFTSLPVTLKKFQVEKDYSSNIITWITTNEENNSHFGIQRSVDGFTFETIGKVLSQAQNGNSQTELNYSFTDLQPKNGTTYYRLEQTDIDGQRSFTESTSILRQDNPLSVHIFPNPVQNEMNIVVSSLTPKKLQLAIYDVYGRTVQAKDLYSESQENRIMISTKEMPSGTYYIQFFENNMRVYHQVIIKE